MLGIAAFAEVAALVGDPARANILYALRDDGAIHAGALAEIAGVAPSTASGHLARLVDAGMISVESRGRQRDYRLTDPMLCDLLDGIEAMAGRLRDIRPVPQRLDRARVHARLCYDHVSGALGGYLGGAIAARGYVRHAPEGAAITEAGRAWLASLGADVPALEAAPRRVIGWCPDWTGAAPHLAGAFGAALLKGLVGRDWLRHDRQSGIVEVTPAGAAGLKAELGLDLRAA
jgi:DNA-binding transcriptional ArsR family regulator